MMMQRVVVSPSPRTLPLARGPASLYCCHPARPACSEASVLPRRELLGIAVATLAYAVSPADAKQAAGDWSAPGLAAPDDPSLPKFFKTTTGVKVQELSPGAGDLVAKLGDAVLFDYILRRANGYFIYGTVEGVSFQPRDVPVGPVAFRLGSGKLIPGLEEVLVGMKKGGKRRALIPIERGYADCATQEPQPPTFGTQRQLQSHCKEPLLFEVELLRITPA